MNPSSAARKFGAWRSVLECEHRNPKIRSTARLSSSALKQAAYEAVLQEGAFRDVYGVPNLALRLLDNRVTAPVNE